MDTFETGHEHKDDAPKHSAAQTLREHSLKAAGISFLLADAALFSYGIASKNPEIGTAAIFGWTEGLVGARYGHPKAEKQLEQIERHLGEYLRQQGIDIPKDPTTQSLAKEGGVIDHVETFLYTYPSQVMNVCFSMIGLNFARDGIKNNSKSMMASGGFLIAGALAGLLIKEQKPDPDHPPEGTLQKAWSWIQEKPLRLTGTLLNLNMATLAMNALQERKANPAQKNYMFKLLAVAAFVFGNTLFAMSSKAAGGGHKLDEKTLGELSEASAHIIAAQPPGVQNALLEHIAGYLATQPSMHMTAQEISAMLHKKMAEFSQTHSLTGWQSRIGDGGAQLQPSF